MAIYQSNNMHADYELIVSLVAEGSKVLDLGCGKGELLELLLKKKVRALGVDIDQENVITCVEKGLTVFQGDLDEGLIDHPNQSYDYVIMNQTLQVVHKPHEVLKEMLRVGKKVIVGFPNFGHWKLISYLFFKSKMPKSKELPFEWYNTPNIHLLTIHDFREYCRTKQIHIDQEIFLRENKILSKGFLMLPGSHFFVDEAIFVIAAPAS